MTQLADIPTPRLTPRQRQMYFVIRQYIRGNGYSPTYTEMADLMDVSRVTIFEHIGELERKGYITRRKHEARSVEIVDQGVRRCPHCHGLI